VNLINAPVLARDRGLDITEQHNTSAPEYSSIVSATIETSEGKITLAGTSLRNEPHIVKIDDYWLDIVPTTPYMLFVDNQDQPGSIGAVGTIAGHHNINISFMEVGRLKMRGRAMMVIGLDDPVPPDVMEEIKALGHIFNVRLAYLGTL
jgi:D-3-phosphoglycerate dehydrogenase